MARQAVVPFPQRGNAIEIIDMRTIKQTIPALATVDRGILHIFVRGSGVGLSVNENCDPTVRSDMTQALLRILPPGPGSDRENARALLMSSSLTLPISNGNLSMGTWQGVYFAQHRPDVSGEIVFTVLEGDTQAGFTFNANRRQSHSIVGEVEKVLQTEPKTSTSCDSTGTVLVHEKHTSASLSLAGADLEPAMREIVPEKWNEEFFQHTYEGPDDMPGHMKSTLLGCSVMVPLANGCASLGNGQCVMLNEHRDVGGFGVGHQRSVQVTSMLATVQHVIQIPPSTFVDGALVFDLTAEVQKAASAPGPGVVHIFAAGPLHSILIAEEAAASILASSLRTLTVDERARAAIGKNGPCVPFGSDGELLLAEGQSIWLYRASASEDTVETADPLPIVITVHTTRKDSVL